MAHTRIKICCISSIEEARLAVEAGADALGLVGPMPSGPGTLELDTIASLSRQIVPPVSRFLLSSETTADGLIAAIDQAGTDTLQIVSPVEPDVLTQIRAHRPFVRLVQVLHVEGKETLSLARACAHAVDALLLDSGRPSAAIPELGGTGRTHDWEISAKIVSDLDIPVFLAGGLSPDNAAEAIHTVHPFGLDLCSGIRTHDRLDPVKLNAFIAAVHAA